MAAEQLGRRRGATGLIAVFAALALLVGLLAMPALSQAGGTASIAKKKCKKKGKKASAAKKKCKKKKKAPGPPAPLVRGTITWNEAVDVDLHAYDSSGAHSGWVGPNPGGIVQGIPSSTLSADANGTNGKTETFTDNIFSVGGLFNRQFTFLICYYGPASGTFTGVTAAGQADTLPFSGSSPAVPTVFSVTGGPPGPTSNPC